MDEREARTYSSVYNKKLTLNVTKAETLIEEMHSPRMHLEP